MTYLLHNGPVLFAAFVVVMSLGAWSIGRALASTWRPFWQGVPYAVLFALAGRLVFWALSGGDNFDFFPAFADVYGDIAVLLAVGAAAYRLTQTRKMVTQYPWLCEQTGPFGWRERKAPNS